MNSSLITKLEEKGYSHRDAVVFVRAQGRCEYCDSELIHNRITWDSIQFDHILPKSKGGDDSDENLALACKPCNNQKMTFVPNGNTRAERIESATAHIKQRGQKADNFWKSISELFKSHEDK